MFAHLLRTTGHRPMDRNIVRPVSADIWTYLLIELRCVSRNGGPRYDRNLLVINLECRHSI
jgi:hypothetical protein